MARLLFKLAQVPDDEANEIRELLEENNIRFYETDAGFWRVGLDAIWLPSTDQEEAARDLIRHYQEARTIAQKQNHAELVQAGAALSLWQSFRTQPFRFLGVLIAVLFVLTLTLVPFLMLLKK
jgi:hypothetical protein